ncbi:hypothetical protein PR202_ga05659 [Eleusine coracana subsp. coracana]|uniref:Uncharacterized protein n=1 Tax=Eleusine coracana subsp. coracana TaxID=191504 RepID=A0AAV5BUL1_ELECO|nr:hypothetical protein PR202_ga05205 [Eleusine coracana subsp. coracana]GJM89464.1 hypothetical protein PR202_ga05659 [Eleusine coracana subsp. coracana]
MAVGAEPSDDIKHKETQVLFDLFTMFINGAERVEHGWTKIILRLDLATTKSYPFLVFALSLRYTREFFEELAQGWTQHGLRVYKCTPNISVRKYSKFYSYNILYAEK